MKYIYKMFLFAGAAYLIGWHDWSGWVFVLAIILSEQIKFDCRKK